MKVLKILMILTLICLSLSCASNPKTPTYAEYLGYQLDSLIQRYPNTEHTCFTKPITNLEGTVVYHTIDCY